MEASPRKLPALLIGGVFLVVLVALAIWAAVSAGAGSTDAEAFRLAGDGRADTAARISQAAWPDGAEAVYLLAEGDPLTATAAGLPGGPVFVVGSCDDLQTPIAEEIFRLAPSRVVAVGGEAAVCDEVIAEALGLAQAR